MCKKDNRMNEKRKNNNIDSKNQNEADEFLAKLFDDSNEDTNSKQKNNHVITDKPTEQLDLFNVDYANNKDLSVEVKQKPFASTNLLMRFRSQLNRVIWTGLNATYTKIFTVVLSRTSSQLAAYQKEQINQRIKKLGLDRNSIDKNTLARLASEVQFPSNIVTRITYSEIDRDIGYEKNNASISKYVDGMKEALEQWQEIKSNGITASFPIFKGIINNHREKYFDFIYNDFMINVLLINPKTGDFVRYPAREIVDLSSVRSQTLLRLLKQLRTVGAITFRKHTTETNGKTRIGLWEQLEVPENTRESKFSNRILKDALIEIAPYFANLNYTKNYGTANGHRVVISYTFTFEPEDPRKNTSYYTADELVSEGLVNIDSALCLNRKDKFKAIDKFLKQKQGTAEKEYLATHPEEDEEKNKKDKDNNVDISVWKPQKEGLSSRDFNDHALGKKVLQSSIAELEDIISDMLKQIRNNKGNMELVADYYKTLGLLQKKKAIERID